MPIVVKEVPSFNGANVGQHMTNQRSDLGEGFYWMAEKLAWGYEETPPDLPEAFRLFKQAADLGLSDAWIRIGQLREHGKGVERDLKGALEAYLKAARAGNFFALAYAAMLLSRSPALDNAEQLWGQFFRSLEARPESEFHAATRGELLHEYIRTQIRLGKEPHHRDVLIHYRLEIAGHHQRVLEHASPEQLDRLNTVFSWIESNLGPWPIGRT